jgi:CRISPR/Cas system-associated protein Cas5 (RAMP superfamily)
MNMKQIRYQVIYKNGQKTPIAEFQRDAQGKFVFEYLDNPKYEFPGFDVNVKKHTSDSLWEQIAFRVPNEIRYEHPGTPLEELLRETNGQLVTDHFEFQLP